MGRRLLYALLLLLAWSVLLAVLMPIPLSAPLRPANVETLDGRTFMPVVGQAKQGDAGLDIQSMDIEEGALQVRPLAGIQASDFPVLRYRFEDFPRNLELVLVFRTREQPDDVRAVTIPTVVSGTGAVDLGAIEAWRGEVVELGFAQYPGPQSVPPASAFRPFTLVEAQLWSPSWRGAWAARMQDWFGPRNWALLSLSALGPDSALPKGRSLVAPVVLCALAALLLGVLVLRWRGPTLVRYAVLCVAVAWLVLDLRWLHGFQARHASTREIYTGLSAEERQRRLPDQALYDSAQMVRRVLGREDRNLRVFVDAGSDFQRARLLYHLLPMNVAPVNMVGLGSAAQRADAILVLYNVRHLTFDSTAGTLLGGAEPMPAAELFDLGPLRVYRFLGAGR
jgi:hypothetical protein